MYGLSSNHIKILEQVFEKFHDVETVKLYGSRAKNDFDDRSDIDLAILGKNISLTTINLIKFDLEESDLPFMIDVQGYPFISNKSLIAHIDRLGKTLYQKDKYPTSSD